MDTIFIIHHSKSTNLTIVKKINNKKLGKEKLS